MKLTTIIIPGRFPGLNEFIKENRKVRGSWYGGNAMKQRDQAIIRHYLPAKKFKGKIFLEYNYFEPNTKRDKDNISSYFHKIFQDALVQNGNIPDDGWKVIKGMADYFEVDSKYPRIEVVIEEIS